jgi:hypothetical protein
MQTVLAKIVADKAIWVEARKQQQRLPVFRMMSYQAAAVFTMPFRVRAPRLSWSVKKLLRQKALSVMILILRALQASTNIMRQPSPC